MSLAPLHDPLAQMTDRQAKTRYQDLYWVIGGCYGDDSRSWRRWSEVIGPFDARDKAAAMQIRMREIFRSDPRVHFDVVRADG